MHRSIVNYFDMMTLTLFGSDALLILFSVILLSVLNNKKVMCQIQRHMKQWYVRHIHSMVDRAKTLADYRRDEVHDDHLHPPVRRRGKGGVAGRMARAVEKGRAPIEMDESVSKNDHTTYDIGSISRGQTQEFTPGASSMTYQPTNTDIVPYMTLQISRDPSLSSLENVFGNYRPQHFENAPNFTSSPMPMSMEIPDAMTNLEDSNIKIKGNELDDSNNEVDGNDPENASGGGEPLVKKKHTIFPKLYGTGIIFLSFGEPLFLNITASFLVE
ncbi:hypothetical protein R3W88_016937 [Solanum pinnatisectum]|uniref:Uncharacterized protein n=1 Tax=Solanum pinnatisectum TaxID=50273 RepID=A0AAV9KZ19_9SOLN|nr:hypothetical protein R3W88_016937 [Solanum pinnatisectum]